MATSPSPRSHHQFSLAILSSWTVLMLVLCLAWLPLGQGKKDEHERCSRNAVAMAMTTCQGERYKLSLASQSNDTIKLCGALEKYSECMMPRIEGCKGPAKMAFDVITGKYASHPYNCQIALDGTNHQGQDGTVDTSYNGLHLPEDSLDDQHQKDIGNSQVGNEVHNSEGITDPKEENDVFSEDHPVTDPVQSPTVNTSESSSSSSTSESEQGGSVASLPTTPSPTIQDEKANNATSPKTRSLPEEFDPTDGNNGATDSRRLSSLLSPFSLFISAYTVLCLTGPI